MDILTSHAMIDSYHRLPPEQTDCPRCKRDALQRCAHAWPLCVTYAVDILNLDAGLAHSLLYQPDDPCSVVYCCVFGEEAFAWRGDIGVPKVCEDDRWFV